MIDKDKLIRELKQRKHDPHYINLLNYSEIIIFQNVLQEIINDIEKGKYIITGYHDVNEFYKE